MNVERAYPALPGVVVQFVLHGLSKIADHLRMAKVTEPEPSRKVSDYDRRQPLFKLSEVPLPVYTHK
jgi:hypothetical protein